MALPEVPLLGVLPGTGGLTRVTDKRKVRHDHADIFCTLVEGVRGQRAKDWRLVDEVVKPARFEQAVRERAQALAQGSDRPADAQGVALTPLHREESADGLSYRYVDVRIDRDKRLAVWTVRAPEGDAPVEIADILAAGAAWWPLQMARELDDAILSMRTNELDIGTWVFKTEGDADRVLAADAALERHADHWFVRETAGMLRRTLARLDVTSRSLFALIEPGSCFAGTLLELALAADRSYMLDDEDAAAPARIVVGAGNFGAYPMVSGQSRLQRRFHEEAAPLEAVRERAGQPLAAADALELGLVTYAPDSIDWDDEVRMMLEERRALSPTR